MTKTEGKPAIAAVKELFATSPDGLRELVRAAVQEMLEAEMTDALGAGKSERTGARLGYRSGYYARTLVTRVGKLELRVPQDRDGRFSTELLEAMSSSQSMLRPVKQDAGLRPCGRRPRGAGRRRQMRQKRAPALASYRVDFMCLTDKNCGAGPRRAGVRAFVATQA